MNANQLKTLSDDQLLDGLESEFQIERQSSRTILLYIKEIETRRLYAVRSYADLREMLIKHFRQSESAAYQRLKAYELMIQVPLVEERLLDGSVNQSTLALAQRQIVREEKITKTKVSQEKKVEIIERITNKTLAEAEVELMKLMPKSSKTPKTHERRTSANATRLSITLPDETRAKLMRLKDIWAHIDPSMDFIELIDGALKMALDKVDPTRKNVKHHTAERVVQTGTKRPTYYSVETDKTLWNRAESRCEYVDEQTGRRCECTFGLERDHVIPLGLGGTNNIANLRLLCKTHNLLMARRHFGDEKIDRAIRTHGERKVEKEKCP